MDCSQCEFIIICGLGGCAIGIITRVFWNWFIYLDSPFLENIGDLIYRCFNKG